MRQVDEWGQGQDQHGLAWDRMIGIEGKDLGQDDLEQVSAYAEQESVCVTGSV